MPSKPEWKNKSIEQIIDLELGSNIEIRTGHSAYASMLAELRETKDEKAFFENLTDHAADAYRKFGGGRKFVIFSDGYANFLFDMKLERAILVWAKSKKVKANSRDDKYHGGYPRAGDDLDKGHFMAHAFGGVEGGPNYFRQARRLNQSISDNGKLWRRIEDYLAANEGLTAFVRPIYAKGNDSDKPNEVEYGLISVTGQFRAVIFPNS